MTVARVFSTVVYVLIVGISCSAGPSNARSNIVPNWVDSGSHPDYPPAQYLSALGEGQSSTDADKLAFLRLGEQLKVDISGTTAVAKAYSSSDNASSYSEDVSMNMAARVDLKDIKGVRIIERYQDSDAGQHYSFAVLDKKAAAGQLAVDVRDLQSRIRSALAKAAERLDAGDPSAAVRGLIQIDADVQSMAAKLAQYSLFASARAYDEQVGAGRALEQQVVDLAGRVGRGTRIAAVGESRRTGTVGQPLAEPFNVRMEYQHNGRDVPLSNVPVRYTADEQVLRIAGASATDGRGQTAVRVNDLAYTEDELNEIRVGIGFDSQSLRAMFQEARLYVSVPRKSRTSVAVVIDIEGISPGASKRISDGIKDMLVQEDYALYDAADAGRADLRVEVKGRIGELPGIGRIKFVEITGAIKLVSTRSNKLIDTVVIEGRATKGGGLGADRAAEKSADKLVDAVRQPLLKAMESNVGAS